MSAQPAPACPILISPDQFAEAIKRHWPSDVYDLAPGAAAMALEQAEDAYAAICELLTPGTDEHAFLTWLRDAVGSLEQFKYLESFDRARAKRFFEAARDFVPAERPEHFALKAPGAP